MDFLKVNILISFKIMSDKEHLRSLVKEAIPSDHEGSVVNFGALRQVLDATIEQPETGGSIKSKSDSHEPAKKKTGTKAGSFGKNAAPLSDIGHFAEKEFEKIFTNFEGSLKGLVSKLDTIEKRVSQLENKKS